MSFLDNLFKKKINPNNLIVKELTKERINNFRLQGYGNVSANWFSLNNRLNYLDAFYTCPPLNSIINYQAYMFSRCTFKHYKKQANGKYKEIKDSNLIKKLNNPNPLQSGNEFLSQLYIYWQVYGNNFIYNATTLDPSNYDYIVNLWNLPNQYLDIKVTNKLWSANSLTDIIKSITLTNTREFFNVENIILINNSGIKYDNGKYLLGSSKIDTLIKPISNILSSLEARNVLLNKRGALGILSNESTDANGTIPLQGTEKEDLQNSFLDYGLSNEQWQIIITDANLKWQQMALPIKDLMLEEGYKRDKIEICDAYSHDILLMNEKEASTFNNLNEAHKSVYSNKIIPCWKILESDLNNFFKLEQKNEYLEICYDDIEVLKEDKSLKLDNSIKEIDIIIKLNTELRNNNISYETALNTLIDVLDYDIDKAKQLVTNETKSI